MGGRDLGALAPEIRCSDAIFIDVVAQEDGQVEILLCRQVAVSAEVAVIPGLARDQPDAETIGGGPGGGKCPEAAHRTLLRPHGEAVEVVGAGLEALDTRMHGMGQLRLSQRCPACCHTSKVRSLGDLPLHRHRAQGHAAVPVLREGLGSQPRPQHDAIRTRVAAGHTEPEEVIAV